MLTALAHALPISIASITRETSRPLVVSATIWILPTVAYFLRVIDVLASDDVTK